MRAVDEWVGASDDVIPPPRVRLRIFDKYQGRCYICTAKIIAGSYWQADHVVALCNGGRNAESNLGPACRNCCYTKTAEDQAEKSDVADKRKRHVLPREKPKSKWKRKMNGQVVLR